MATAATSAGVGDVVSGVFFLIDDAFRVGEYIRAGALKGTVEGISMGQFCRSRTRLKPCSPAYSNQAVPACCWRW
jgi:hypothetical protein